MDRNNYVFFVFLSTPSGWRATIFLKVFDPLVFHFYPRPPGGGRRSARLYGLGNKVFLSTPSGWRATEQYPDICAEIDISIHALRVEGDHLQKVNIFLIIYFYPRPPGGGRLACGTLCVTALVYFYPRPPGGGRPRNSRRAVRVPRHISIHALRVEGDGCRRSKTDKSSYFYPRPPGGGRPQQDTDAIGIYLFLSTPSGWRATLPQSPRSSTRSISIHALRVEGDAHRSKPVPNCLYFYPRPPGGGRRGGETISYLTAANFYPRPPGGGRLPDLYIMQRGGWDFYPRPPGGGRPRNYTDKDGNKRFLSTPSGWRATTRAALSGLCQTISIHALRVEGDVEQTKQKLDSLKFLSTPSGWRATHYICPEFLRRCISIHALRVEGDRGNATAGQAGSPISIHALRVEGDCLR